MINWHLADNYYYPDLKDNYPCMFLTLSYCVLLYKSVKLTSSFKLVKMACFELKPTFSPMCSGST